ncbi:unnamed protein product [Penicillium olsonii]|uniref:EKC/KEOPS complex subunit BUD32 n=1 Tax=Penicillium olsonii TaxID=99116 RepID=A0A9W4MN64_PENOL|nr:unnamed protein product [Penicillium olsonii]CAG8176118.1 unnamed protein product [Penicillium olsonii]
MVHFVKSTVLGGNFETPERYVHDMPFDVPALRGSLQIYRSQNPEDRSFRSCLVCHCHTARLDGADIFHSSSWDQVNQQYVAVKKILDPFGTPATAHSIFREIKLLKRIQHENACHFSARGLKYLHSAGIPHRDLRPENILINQNCDLKICDLGLPVQDTHTMSYTPTRCYRAPELLLASHKYDEKVDVWSVGCIFAEMLQGKPLFAGRNHVEQFCAITELLGTPNEDLLARIASQSTLHFIQSLPSYKGTGLPSLFSSLDSTGRRSICFYFCFPSIEQITGLDLLGKLLVFDPHQRICASDALAAPYLAAYHDPTDEPVADHTYDWSIHERCSNAWKMELYFPID